MTSAMNWQLVTDKKGVVRIMLSFIIIAYIIISVIATVFILAALMLSSHINQDETYLEEQKQFNLTQKADSYPPSKEPSQPKPEQ